MTNQYPGVSVPFSEKEPTEAEIALTEKLENTLKKHGMYEDTERTEQR
jgi:poly(A) polymerase Pap1